MTKQKNGRNRPRLHILAGDWHKKLCVNGEVTEASKEEVVAGILMRLEKSMPQGSRKRPANPDAHSIQVRFVLGVAEVDLGIPPLSVSITDLRKGNTDSLFKRIDDAHAAALAELGPVPEPAHS